MNKNAIMGAVGGAIILYAIQKRKSNRDESNVSFFVGGCLMLAALFS